MVTETISKDSLREFLKKKAPSSTNLDIDSAIYWYCEHYNSGSDTDLYKIAADWRPNKAASAFQNENSKIKQLYCLLVDEIEFKWSQNNIVFKFGKSKRHRTKGQM